MLTPKVKLQIFQHAKEVFPHECCGIVTQKGRAQKYHRIKNASKDPENEFILDSNEYSDIAFGLADNESIVYVVHSHTGDGATTRPSPADICSCNECEIPYVIVSIPEGDYRVNYPWWEKRYNENIYDDNWIKEGFELVKTSDIPIGSMIMMQVQSEVTNHAGIYIGNNRFIHHLYGKMSSVDIYSDYWRERTVRIVRHKDLPEDVTYDPETD